VRRARLALAAVGGTALIWLGFAVADQATPAPPPEPGPIAKAVAAGRHVRIDGPRGPIHVWIPASYRADTGGTVLYIHGYFDNVDTAWTGHQLPEQFAMSGLNAMFVAPEAPVAQKIPVNYPDVGELLRLVEDATGVSRGASYTAAVGHSGAFRTIQAWLDEPTLDHITMIDAMYGEEELIAAWLRASPRRRLITVGEDTVLGTESFAQKFPTDTFTVDRFPPSYELWPAGAKTAKHLYVRAQFLHMPLVTDGIVIPSLLKLLPIERLGDLPWALPLGSLPPLADAGVTTTP
jgi:hypothetical protein